MQPLSGPCRSARPNTAALDDESTVSSEWTRRRGFPGFSCRLIAVEAAWSCDTGLKTDTIYLLTIYGFKRRARVLSLLRLLVSRLVSPLDYCTLSAYSSVIGVRKFTVYSLIGGQISVVLRLTLFSTDLPIASGHLPESRTLRISRSAYSTVSSSTP